MSRGARARPLLLPATTILRRPGVRHPMRLEVVLGELRVGDTVVAADEPVLVDVVLEAINDSITVTGEIVAHYRAACRRCLELTDGEVRADVQEIFERRPTEGETYLLEGEVVDLEPMVRETLLLSLPLAPLCREDCAGPAPETYPATIEGEAVPDRDERGAAGGGSDGRGDDRAVAGAAPGADEDSGDEHRPLDPRWAALRDLKLD